MIQFTFNYIKDQFIQVLQQGYTVVTCKDFATLKSDSLENVKILINRVDIDYSVKKALELTKIFNDLNIKASFFIRLHAPEYNPFSFENYRILKYIKESGHEIGYHSEVIDQSVIWDENAVQNLKRDIEVMNTMLDIQISGVASHGGMTGNNNLDFWQNHKAKDFGLLYEAYDWFKKVFYVSDSEWTRWKCYNKGSLIKNNYDSLATHAKNNHPILYSLIHSDTYFNHHFYE